MSFSVEGRTAFVTGGANGIGLGLARALLAAGARVAIADILGDALDAAVENLGGGDNLMAVPLDVRDRAQWQQARQACEARLGPVTILVNNAGVLGFDPIIDTPPDYFEWVIDVNLIGTFNGIHTFGRLMVDRGLGGHIVNTSSVSGLYGAETLTLGAYCASKFGVTALSEQLRKELADHGIGVSHLCPGSTRTSLSGNIAKLQPVAEGIPLAENPILANLADGPRAEGLDPDLLGPFVVRAIEENREFIIPQPHYAELIEERHQRILADCKEAADPNAVIPEGWRTIA